MTTILTEDRTEEDVAHDEAVALDWERFQILLNICFEHYTHVDTKLSLENFTRMVVTIGNDFTGDTFDKIPKKGRDRLLGEIITKAVNHDMKKHRDPNKVVFKSLVKDLVERAHDDDHKKSKAPSHDVTAFEFVAGLLFKYGIKNQGQKYSSSTISNWCDKK